MDKSNPPSSFGVFKPVDHVVLAFENSAATKAVADELRAQGFAACDVVHYTPEEMKDQVDANLLTASPLASLGQDLNLIKSHRALALLGCSFLVVYAPLEAQVQNIRTIANTMNAKLAQRYGTLIVEELLDAKGSPHQAFESPDRGLDTESTAWQHS
jgi:hypothetical protein